MWQVTRRRITKFAGKVAALVRPPLYGPHRETHYTNWFLSRSRGVNHVYDYITDCFPTYVSNEANRRARGIITALEYYDYSPRDVEEINAAADERRLDREPRPAVVVAPNRSRLLIEFRDGTTQEINSSPAPTTLVPFEADTHDPEREYIRTVTDSDLVSMLVQQCHLNFGIMCRNTHNSRVYDRYAKQIMDNTKVRENVQARIMPFFRFAVYQTNSHERMALALNNTHAATESQRVVLRPPRLWRGWFLPSVTQPGNAQA